MTEFALALPLLVAVLATLLVMGWFMMRKQRVVVASRYAVWRGIEGEGPTAAELNRRMLYAAAAEVKLDRQAGPEDALHVWSDEAAASSPGARDLAEELLLEQWPPDDQTRLEVRYLPPMRMAERFSNEMSFRHGRAGLPWRRGEASPWAAMADMYYHDLDIGLTSVGEPAEGLAEAIRGLYYVDW